MRYKIVVEYDGTAFCGWQIQKNGVSITGVLQDALKICQRQKVVVHGSGRTDAGVHAYAQVAHFDLDKEVDAFSLMGSLNALVQPHLVCVKSCDLVADNFHARFEAQQRTYIYKIQNTLYPPILNKNKACHFSKPLDENAMQVAAMYLLGKHDFSTFRAAECQAKSAIKVLDEVRVWRENDMVYMEVKAKSFLHHQVRNFAGSLMFVGCGKWSVQDFKRALDACDRAQGGPTAVPEGLYFVSVQY